MTQTARKALRYDRPHPGRRMSALLLAVLLTLAFSAGCGAMPAPEPSASEPAVPVTAAPLPNPTATPLSTATRQASAGPTPDMMTQLEQISQLLHKQISGSLAYNRPESMQLGQTVTIELLLNPSVSEQQLGGQVTESGPVTTATVEITPQMKAVLISPLPEAFTIQPIQEAIQLVSADETTRWSWSVTARKSGTQRLLLVVYRLVRFEGQDYWREVQTYQADIPVQVSFVQRLLALNWAAIISTLAAVLSVPFIWAWLTRRRKKRG
jgi:hypothetical protein